MIDAELKISKAAESIEALMKIVGQNPALKVNESYVTAGATVAWLRGGVMPANFKEPPASEDA